MWLQTIVKIICLCHCACWPDSIRKSSFRNCFPQNNILHSRLRAHMWFLLSFNIILFSSFYSLVYSLIYRRSIKAKFQFLFKHICSFSHDEKLRHVSGESDQWNFYFFVIIKQRTMTREEERDWKKLLKLRNLLMKYFRFRLYFKLLVLVHWLLFLVVCHMFILHGHKLLHNWHQFSSFRTIWILFGFLF